MNRSRKIILISHCLLNANSKIRGAALNGTVLLPVIEFLLKKDVGIIQLPCPEHSFAGESRWEFRKVIWQKNPEFLWRSFLEFRQIKRLTCSLWE